MSLTTDPAERAYEHQALTELAAWQAKMLRPPGLLARTTRGLQTRINRAIPEQVHAVVTGAIEQMIRGVLVGADFITREPWTGEATLSARELAVKSSIDGWRKVAAAEGGVTGAGGFLLNLADFPVLIGIKLKLLFEIAALYGHAGEDFAERLYILQIFQLAFSGAEHRARVFHEIECWEARRDELPTTYEGFDWRKLQQEYRDYIDLAKLAQMLPVVGAPVGAVVNWRLTEQLGDTAIAAYRMRWFEGRGGAGQGLL
jgi:hypothetical protein